jgi:integrase
LPKLLTVAGIQRLRPHAKRREIRDAGAPGLHLIIQPSGVKSWAVRLRRPDGRPAKLTLGSTVTGTEETADEAVLGGALTLRQARELANKLDRQRATGVDVVGMARQRKHRDASADSFVVLARDYITDHARPRNRGWRSTAKILGLLYDQDEMIEPTLIPGAIAERWAALPAQEITGAMLFDVVSEARRVAIPGTPRPQVGISDARGRSMAAALGKLMGWAFQHRRISQNPAAGLFRPPSPQSRHRVLTEAELRALWAALDQLSLPFATAFRLLVLTGARRSEVSGMRWCELSEDLSTWTLPVERSKNKRPHTTSLPPMARDLLASIPRLGPHVFSVTGRVPIAGFSAIKRQLDATLGFATPWVIHDIRRSAVTMMCELGIAPHIVEALVNHTSGHKASVAGVYNRASYAAEKKNALAQWATHLQGVVTGLPADVVPIPLRGGQR